MCGKVWWGPSMSLPCLCPGGGEVGLVASRGWCMAEMLEKAAVLLPCPLSPATCPLF